MNNCFKIEMNNIINIKQINANKVITEKIKSDIEKLKEKKGTLHKLLTISRRIYNVTKSLKHFEQRDNLLPNEEDTQLDIEDKEESRKVIPRAIGCYTVLFLILSMIAIFTAVYFYIKL